NSMKDLNNYSQWLQKQNLAPNTISNYLQAVKVYGNQQLNTENLNNYLKSNLTKHEPSTLYTRVKALTVYAKFKQLKIH
ncbi:12250_t:CDS:1, partial [Entrophospora sp. SA101]